MKIVCIGDSLTEGDYGVFGKSGIGNVKEKNYPYFLAEMLPEHTVLNCGKCGHTSTTYLELYKDGFANTKGADIIIIMLGTNGGLDDEIEVQGNADYKTLIDMCSTDAPNAKIILCTPPHATENPEYSNFGYVPKVKKAVKFVRKFANEYSYQIIDVAECGKFTAQNEAIMQPNDGLHFSEIGYKTLAEVIKSGLQKLSLI